MNKKKNNKEKKTYTTVIWVLIAVVFVAMVSSSSKWLTTDSKPENNSKPADNITTKPVQVSNDKIDNKPVDNNDPLGLSYSDNTYLNDSQIRNRLNKSELEYCSYLIKNDYGSYTLTWNLASNGKEVYRCDYTYNRHSKGNDSVAACSVSEGYEDYKAGDKRLIREYIMPEADDHIDMWVYENSSSYYDEHFILGKYSDMECYVKGDDIFFTYYWYQDTEDGPVLVYRSNAKNTTTTSGQRYNDDLWDLYEESYKNINIIPYEDYPRDYDYYEVYKDYKNKDRKKKEEEDLKDKLEIYCSCQDEMDLYSEYMEDFYDYDDASDFWEKDCR